MYHINPETGNPGICSAKIKCRFGATEHYDTPEAARDAYEAQQERTNFEPTGYVGPNGDIAIAEAFKNGEGTVVYRRAGDDDWQVVAPDGRLLQAETPSGRYESYVDAITAAKDLAKPNASTAILENISFEGTPEHQAARKEQLATYLQQAQAASTSLEASKYQWFALGLRGQGEGQKALGEAYEETLKKFEANWREGDKFDTSIEGPISLTNKSQLVRSSKVGLYTTPSGDYNVYRRGAGPAVSFGRSKKYGSAWVVSKGPGGSQFVVKDKRVAAKAAVVLHDLEVAQKTGKWNSSLSVAEAQTVMGKLSSINPGGFPSNSVPRYLEALQRFA